MALNFPANPTDGAEWIDPSNGITYKYNASNNSWSVLSSTGGGGGSGSFVSSVNSQTGDVVLDYSDVNATNQTYVDQEITSTKGYVDQEITETKEYINHEIEQLGDILTFRGSLDMTTVPAPGDATIGDVIANTTDGTAQSSWGISGSIEEGDLFSLGTDSWTLVGHADVDLTGYATVEYVDNEIAAIGSGGSGFDGDYNNLTNKPTIGNATITLNQGEGRNIQTFKLNETNNIEIPLNMAWYREDMKSTPETTVVRNGSADINARLFRSFQPDIVFFDHTLPTIAMAFRHDEHEDDNYLRFSKDKSGIRNWLDAPTKTGSGASGNWNITAATATNCTRSILSGNGLSGGGQLNANQTLAVKANGNTISVSSSGISVNASNLGTVPTATSANAATNINTAVQNGSTQRGIAFWSGVGSTGNQRLWSTANNVKVNPGANQFIANSFKANGNTYTRSAQLSQSFSTEDETLPFGFYSSRFLVTEITDDTQGSYRTHTPFDYTKWNDLPINTRDNRPVIIAQTLENTDFSYLLGNEHVDENDNPAQRGVDYVSLIPALVDSVRQLVDKIESIETRLDALENN